MAFGLVPGNHVIERDDEEVARSVNLDFNKFLYEVRRNTFENGKCAPMRSTVLDQKIAKLKEELETRRLK